MVKPNRFYSAEFCSQVGGAWGQNWKAEKGLLPIFAYHRSGWSCEFSSKGDLQGSWAFNSKEGVGLPRLGSYLPYVTLVTISCAWPCNTLQIKVLFLMALKLLPGVR